MDLTKSNQTGVVIIGNNDGHAVIPTDSPIRRLRYFDGKFLRAPDMQLEQQGLLNYSRFSNQAGGAGMVYGFSIEEVTASDSLLISGGLGIDAAGNVLYMPQQVTVAIQELIDKSTSTFTQQTNGGSSFTTGTGFEDCTTPTNTSPPGEVVTGQDLYVITVEYTNALCGEDDVYGKLCEEACISSKERPYQIDGVLFRAVPLRLSALLPSSTKVTLTQTHLRSRVATAYFEQESENPGSLISKEGLQSALWCRGAEALGGAGVPIGVLARNGGKTIFLDAWIARRERIDVPPKQYWYGRMAMRSWQVYLAQILQFQCQLRSVFGSVGVLDNNPCQNEHAAIKQTMDAYQSLIEEYAKTAELLAKQDPAILSVSASKKRVSELRKLSLNMGSIVKLNLPERMLINGGIVTLPSAGYLPVNPVSNITGNEQVRRMMGEGVDLRFCVVRPDYVPHALEEAQHMERISLLQGLDNPANKPRVDVLVPNGRIEPYKEAAPGIAYEMYLGQFMSGKVAGPILEVNRLREKVSVPPTNFTTLLGTIGTITGKTQGQFKGAARDEHADDGSYAFYYAAEYVNDIVLRPIGDISFQKYKVKARVLRATSGTVSQSEINTFKADILHQIHYSALSAASDASQQRGSSTSKAVAATLPEPEALMWASINFAKDPFSLNKGESTHCRAELDLGVIFTKENNISVGIVPEFSLSGYLSIVDIVDTGRVKTLKCSLSADVHLKVTIVSGADRQETNQDAHFQRELTFSRAAASNNNYDTEFDIPVITYIPRIGNIGLRFSRKWQTATQTVLTASLVTSQYEKLSYQQDLAYNFSAPTVNTLFLGKQIVNPDVLKPDNGLHGLSVKSLGDMGRILKNPAYADINAKLLFPPPKPVPDALQVFATEDWVLFHRRRDINCGYDKFPQVLTVPRRYRVYHVNVKNLDAISALLDTLKGGANSTPTSSIHPQAVEIVEFDAGIQSLNTSVDAVRTDWQMHVPVNEDIALGVIASQGAAYDEGQDLAMARLQSLADALSAVNKLDDNVEFDVLETIPNMLVADGVDGVVLLATVSVALTCHEIYRAELSHAGLKKFLSNLSEQNVSQSELLNMLETTELQHVSSFRSGKWELFGANATKTLLSDWNAVSHGYVDGVPYNAITLVPKNPDGTTPTNQPYQKQAHTLAVALGAAADAGGEIFGVSDFNSNSSCSAITVLVSDPDVQAQSAKVDMYAVVRDGQLPQAQALQNDKLSKTIPEGEGFFDFMTGFNKANHDAIKPLGMVDFIGKNQADPASVTRVKAAGDGWFINSGTVNTVEIYFITKQGVTANTSPNQSRVEQIVKGLDTKANTLAPGVLPLGVTVTYLTDNSGDHWNTQGDAVMFVVGSWDSSKALQGSGTPTKGQ